jgi:hypothetical protein
MALFQKMFYRGEELILMLNPAWKNNTEWHRMGDRKMA